MAPSRKSAYGAPPEGREVVITLDRRLLYGVGLLVVFVIALMAGMGSLGWWRGGQPQPESAPEAVAGDQAAPGQPPGQIDEASARATAMALGLPTSAVIVDTNIRPVAADQVAASGTPEASAYEDPFAEIKAKITPVDDLQAALLKDPGSVPLEIPENFEGKAADWPPDVLARFPDANLHDEQYLPLRYEEVDQTYEGPRLAVSDLNEFYTYNFGTVPIDEVAVHEFLAVNVGNEDLLISRVYAACGCTSTYIGDRVIDPAGFIQPEPLRLRPGESVPFDVQFDPRAQGVRGSQAKYIQIFTNDPSGAIFDPKDPNSHEARFRIVVNPQ